MEIIKLILDQTEHNFERIFLMATYSLFQHTVLGSNITS